MGETDREVNCGGRGRDEMEANMNAILDMLILRNTLDNLVEMLSKQMVNEFNTQGMDQN